jgi:hypothetical protein
MTDTKWCKYSTSGTALDCNVDPVTAPTAANPTSNITLGTTNGSASTFMRSDASPKLDVTIAPTWTGNHIFAPSSGHTNFSAGNVGIGSSAPNAKLDVEGTIYVGNGNIGIGSSVPNGALDVGTGAICLGHTCNTSWPAGGSSQWLTNGVMIGTTGNVGIGSTAPQAKLDVEGVAYFGVGNVSIGTITPSGVLTIYANGGQPDVRLGSADLYSWQIQRISNGNLNFNNASNSAYGTQVTFQDNSGNVGIGITAPRQKMDVVGNIYATGNIGIGSVAPAGAIDVGSGSVCIGHTCNSSWPSGISGLTPGKLPKALTASTLTDSMLYSNGTNMGIGSTVPQAKLDIEGGLYVGIGNVSIGSATPSQKLDVLGNVYVNGNIGIGSAIPANKLDVWGTGTSSATTNLNIHDSTGVNLVNILDNGNVGINSTAPQQKLDVLGSIYAGGTGDSYLNPTSGNVGIGTSVFSGKLVIAGGNVGVGSTLPRQVLDVVGTVNASTGFSVGVSIGTSGTGATSCLCKTFTNGICTVIGTCT